MNKQAKIILFSCLYITGILSAYFDLIFPFSFLIVSILLIILYKKLISLKYFFVLCFIFLLGIINTFFNIKYFDNLSLFANKIINAEAKVLTIPSNNNPQKTSFYAKINKIEFDGVIYDNLNSKSFVSIKDDKNKFKSIKIGDNLRLTGKLKLPAASQNPYQFDYAKYLQQMKTFSLFYVDDDWQIQNHSLSLKDRILRKLNDKRSDIINIHANNIKSPMLEILGGIIFGDDAVNPDENTKISFMHSGIIHILAASGMNVTLIFGIWFFFARSFKLNYKISIIIGIFLILVYTCMTGFGPPIIRATIMLTLILIGKLLDRETPTLAILFLVAFLMLLYNPLMLFNIGFQLSFIVTFALILTAPLLVFNFKYNTFNRILGMVIIPIIAQIYAAPLQLFYFNTFTVYSVFANIVIIPVLSIVSFIGFISSIIALIPLFAYKICYVADLILNPLLYYIVKVANLFSKLPHSVILIKQPSLFQIILYFIIVTYFIIILKIYILNKSSDNKESKVKSDPNINNFYHFIKLNKKIFLPFFILSFIMISGFISINKEKMEILFFSVGNADAILIKSPLNKYFLIDSGKLPYLSSNSQAKSIILKYFVNKGINVLDSLIITHFDSDHAGGVIDILDGIKTKNIFLTDTFEDTNLSENILQFIRKNNLPSSIVSNEITIYSEKDFIISLIKPYGDNIKNENQKSIITHIKYKNNNLLFMGDGDINSYNFLPQKFKENISIMKVGHHGADNTLNDQIAKNISVFLISTGENIYNHPHPNTINVIEQNHKLYFRTDLQNAVKVIFNKDDYNIFLYSPKYHKFILSK